MFRSRLLAAAALATLAAGAAEAQPRGATPMTPVSPQAPASPTAPPSPTPTTPTPGAGQAVTGTTRDAAPGPAATVAPAPASAANAPAASYTPVVAAGDVAATLKGGGQFTTLLKVADATGLTPVLARPGLTIFAPTDAAFAASGADVSEAGLRDAANLQKLQGVLTYHVVNAVIPDFAGRAASVTAANNQKVYLDATTAGTVKVNDATALQPALKVGASTIYPIDKVITPGFTPPTPPPEEAAPAEAASAAKATTTKSTTTKGARRKR